MIIKDGDFYSALAHLKEAQKDLTDNDGGINTDRLCFVLEQIEAAEIALKSAITDELDENGEIKAEFVVCWNCGKMYDKNFVLKVQRAPYYGCPHCDAKIIEP